MFDEYLVRACGRLLLAFCCVGFTMALKFDKGNWTDIEGHIPTG